MELFECGRRVEVICGVQVVSEGLDFEDVVEGLFEEGVRVCFIY